MKGKLITLALLAVPAIASAQENVGTCGWGSKLMEGNKGIAPQVLAVTTNGTFGNQTFGITSGTSGCTQNGVVKSNWKMSMFIEENKTKLAREMSVGQGETLESLATLLGVEDAQRGVFFSTAKANFGEIFPGANVSSEHVLSAMKSVLAKNEQLKSYSEKI